MDLTDEITSVSSNPSQSINVITGIENASHILINLASYVLSSEVNFSVAAATPTVAPAIVVKPVKAFLPYSA